MQLATAAVVHAATDQDWLSTATALVAGAMGLLLTYVVSSKAKLHDTLIAFDEQHQQLEGLMVEGEVERRRKKGERRRHRDEIGD